MEVFLLSAWDPTVSYPLLAGGFALFHLICAYVFVRAFLGGKAKPFAVLSIAGSYFVLFWSIHSPDHDRSAKAVASRPWIGYAVRARTVKKEILAYKGNARPRLFGIPTIRRWGDFADTEWVAVSVQKFRVERRPGLQALLKGRQPETIVGKTIWLFRLTEPLTRDADASAGASGERRDECERSRARAAPRHPGRRIASVLSGLMEKDRNGDNRIGKDEAPRRVRRNFDTIDTNKDGFIEQDEIDAMLGRVPEQTR